jgi:hypothetical protein
MEEKKEEWDIEIVRKENVGKSWNRGWTFIATAYNREAMRDIIDIYLVDSVRVPL